MRNERGYKHKERTQISRARIPVLLEAPLVELLALLNPVWMQLALAHCSLKEPLQLPLAALALLPGLVAVAEWVEAHLVRLDAWLLKSREGGVEGVAPRLLAGEPSVLSLAEAVWMAAHVPQRKWEAVHARSQYVHGAELLTPAKALLALVSPACLWLMLRLWQP